MPTPGVGMPPYPRLSFQQRRNMPTKRGHGTRPIAILGKLVFETIVEERRVKVR